MGALTRALCAHAGLGGASTESGLPPTAEADIVAATAAVNHYTAATAADAVQHAATPSAFTVATVFVTVQCFLLIRQ